MAGCQRGLSLSKLACKAALHSLRQLSYDDDGDDDDDVFYVQIYFSVVVYKGYC